MNRRVQIVLTGPYSGQPGTSPVPGPLSRLKLILGGVLFAAVAVGILVIALILGSIIVAFLWIALVIATVALILRATVRRRHP